MNPGSAQPTRFAEACETFHKPGSTLDPMGGRQKSANSFARACEKFHKVSDRSKSSRENDTVEKDEGSVQFIAAQTEGPRPIASRERTRTYSGAGRRQAPDGDPRSSGAGSPPAWKEVPRDQILTSRSLKKSKEGV